MNNNGWSAHIEKLMIWRTNNWIKYESRFTLLSLRIHYDQLFITSESKILESYNMNTKMKGIYKDDVLILIASDTGKEVKKIKFQVKMDAHLCFQKLGEHFPVLQHNSLPSINCMQNKYKKIDEIFKNVFNNEGCSSSIPLPTAYENFVKLCLLDPTFPQIVAETAKIINENVL